MKKEVGLFIIYLLITGLFLFLVTDPNVWKALLKTLLKPLK